MNKDQYLENRQGLIDKAQNLIDEGKFKEAENVNEEIKNLDEAFEAAAKAQANINALKNNPVIDLTNKNIDLVGGTVIEKENKEANEKENIYVNAWGKYMLNRALTQEEKNVFDEFNTLEARNSVMTTETHEVLIPTTVVAGIWKEIGESYPLYQDVFKTNVKGNLTVLKSTESSDSAWYEEGEAIEDGSEDFANATLHGCELARSVSVSYKLKEMSVEEFIPFIQSQLAEKMGKGAAYGVFEGKGVAASGSNQKDEPRGIKTALLSDDKVQVVQSDGEVSYDDITKMISLVKGSYKKGAKFYASSDFIWNKLTHIVDNTGKPYFISDTTSSGVGHLFGFIVEEDDSVDTLLFGNAYSGYHLNTNKEMALDQEEHKKDRYTDYLAYAIMDGDIRTSKAFSYLEITPKA